MYSRAIHIELVDDLSTDAFINALCGFISTRGMISALYCDHGTSFVSAKNELKRQYELSISKEVMSYLKDKTIEFCMTKPTASHQGTANQDDKISA